MSDHVGRDRVFVGRVKYRSIAKVGRIRGVCYNRKAEVEDKS